MDFDFPARRGTESAEESREMTHGDRHRPADGTPFNERLVSSTPDPDRLMEAGSLDINHLPDTDEGPGGETLFRHVGKDGAAVLLSDSERQRIREKLDAALSEESRGRSKRLVRHRKGFQKIQPHHLSRKLSLVSGKLASSPRPLGQLPGSKIAFGVSQSTRAGNGTPPVLKSSRSGVAQKHGPGDRGASVGGANTIVPGDQSVNAVPVGGKNAPVTPPASTSHDTMGSGLETRVSDIGVFHHFHSRDSNGLSPYIVQTSNSGPCGQVFVPLNAELQPNTSMGFTPNKGNQTGPFGGLSSGTNPSSLPIARSVLEPRAIETHGSFAQMGAHSAQGTHTASPVGSPRSKALAFQTPEDMPRNPQFHFEHRSTSPLSHPLSPCAKQSLPDLLTLAISPEKDKCELKFPTSSSRGQQSLSLKPRKAGLCFRFHEAKKGSLPNSLAEKRVEGDNYTTDGYYINRLVDAGGAGGGGEAAAGPAWPLAPTPVCSPEVIIKGRRHVEQASNSAEAPFHLNSSSSTCSNKKQLNTNQNMRSEPLRAVGSRDRAYSASGIGDLMDPASPSKEDVPDFDSPGYPLNRSTQVLGNENEVVPSKPTHPLSQNLSDHEGLTGPRRLRMLMRELKETCAVDGKKNDFLV